MLPGAANNPAIAVNTTSDITRGFNKEKKSPNSGSSEQSLCKLTSDIVDLLCSKLNDK